MSVTSPQPTLLVSVVPGDGRVTMTREQGADNAGFGAYGIWVDGQWDHDVDARGGDLSTTMTALSDGTALRNGVEHEVAVTVVTCVDDANGRTFYESPLSNRIRDAAGDLPPGTLDEPRATADGAATTVTWARSSEADVVQYVAAT